KLIQYLAYDPGLFKTADCKAASGLCSEAGTRDEHCVRITPVPSAQNYEIKENHVSVNQTAIGRAFALATVCRDCQNL
ncbi:MAG TPA: hypothetical protein VKH62_11995, partial [Candidatus Binatia bacterium]|nr:hypothetical protein [Candidatus Binatia bacterium]